MNAARFLHPDITNISDPTSACLHQSYADKGDPSQILEDLPVSCFGRKGRRCLKISNLVHLCVQIPVLQKRKPLSLILQAKCIACRTARGIGCRLAEMVFRAARASQELKGKGQTGEGRQYTDVEVTRVVCLEFFHFFCVFFCFFWSPCMQPTLFSRNIESILLLLFCAKRNALCISWNVICVGSWGYSLYMR